MLSPATASPLSPSSWNAWLGGPPIVPRFPVTVNPVLTGSAPGVTATVSNTLPPCCTLAGEADPVPLGFMVPHGFVATLVLRGFGAPVAKSAELLFVSVQPLALRKPAVVLERVA